MVVHCQRPLEIPVEKLDIKRTMISLLFGKMMTKKLIDKNHSFKQNIPIAKEFITDTKRDFIKEK